MKNKTKTISLLVAVCMMLTLLPAVAFAAPMEDITVTNIQRYSNKSLKSFVLDYEPGLSYWGNHIYAATMRVGIQETQFNHPSGSLGDCGDFTEMGSYAQNHSDYDDWDDVTGVIWAKGDGILRPATGGTVDPVTIEFAENALTPVVGKTYYVYAWAKYANSNGDVYPDAFLFSFTVDASDNVVTDADPGTGGGTTPTPKTYSISFNRNTQDSAATGDMEAQIFTEGVPQAIKANEFSVPGHVFKEWNTEQNGGGTSYTDKQEITLNEDIMNGRSGFSLYAQWDWDTSGGGNTGTGGTTNPGTTIPTVDASSGISLWYNGGNSFGSSKSAVPTSVEIDGVPVSFNGNGREFTVGCISPNAKWVTVNWNSTSVTTNFTPDANATCAEITLPKTGDVSVMAFALMAVVAAAGAMGKK